MLFEGTKFWVAQRVPMRNHYLKVIRDNGGEVVPLEKQADLLIADHMRKDAVPGSISWTFIQDSVKNNSLESTADHVCGRPLGTVREAASAAPTKSTRTDYTAEDDRVAYKWGKEADERGASSRGNVIWKQLEVLNPRHTWQSWRDRWVKRLCDGPPPAGWEDAPVETENADEDAVDGLPERHRRPRSRTPEARPSAVKVRPTTQKLPENLEQESSGRSPPENDALSEEQPDALSVAEDQIFTTEDFLSLYSNAKAITNTTKADLSSAWEECAEDTSHTVQQWKDFFEDHVQPAYEEYAPRPNEEATGLDILQVRTKLSPDQPYSGWPKLGGERMPSSSKKRKLDEVVISDSLAKMEDRQQANVKKHRIDRHLEDAVTHVFEDAHEEILESIDTTVKTRITNTVDLTLGETSSSFDSSDDDEEDQEEQERPRRPEVDNDTHDNSISADEDNEIIPLSTETQGILAAETQAIDFDLPEPADGFTYSSNAELDENTQDVVTEDVDETILGMPEPEGGFDHTSQAEEPPTDEENGEDGDEPLLDFNTIADSLMKKGFSAQSIIAAVHATSGNLPSKPFNLALTLLNHGHDIPASTRGIWTEEDDFDLQGSDARLIQRVETKHGERGPEGWRNRIKFLKDTEASQEEML